MLSETTENYNIYIFIASIIAIVSFGSIIVNIINEILNKNFNLKLFIISIWVFILSLVAVCACNESGIVTQQKVLIDDTVPLKAFVDKYKIIDRDGGVFTIQLLEKETVNEE